MRIILGRDSCLFLQQVLLVLSSGDTSILQVVLGKDLLFTESSKIVITLTATVSNSLVQGDQ